RRTRPEMTRFLLTRGLWLVFLEVAYVRIFFMGGDLTWQVTPLAVIWALGMSMVVLAGLIWLPRAVVLAFAVVMIVGHNALDGVKPDQFGGWDWLWKILHAGGGIPIGNRIIAAAYPLIPWVGVMALGYASGPLFKMDSPIRRRAFVAIGLSLLIAFVILRWSNIYGDPRPWTVQPRGAVYTVLSFLDVHKYPPSLLYLLAMHGLAL